MKLLLAGHGGEGSMWLDVASVVGTYCSGIVDWRYYLDFPISCLPDGLEKVLSSHPSGWALFAVFKALCGDSGSGESMVSEDVLLLVRSLYLVGDDEDDGLDGVFEVRCEVILAKVWDHIVFSFFCGVVCNRFRHC
jgi:hypothetical protein